MNSANATARSLLNRTLRSTIPGFSWRSLSGIAQNGAGKPVMIVSFVLMTVAGLAVAVLASMSILKPDSGIEIGKRHDFIVPICGDGALMQWFVAGGETLRSVSVHPAGPMESSAYLLRARLLTDSMATIDESVVSVAETDAGGWLAFEFAPTPLTSGRRYGVHLSSAVPGDRCLGLDAHNSLRIGWGHVANAGLDVNGTLHRTQAIHIRVDTAGGVKPAVHMLAQAARGNPESAVALVIAGAAWFVTLVSLVLRLPGSRLNPGMTTLALAAAISLTAGTELAGIAWLLG